MSRDYRLFLEDIWTCCQKVLRYTQGMTHDEWLDDEMVFDATMRNLEIIGEAIGRIPDDVRARHSYLEWRRIKAFRNVVAHHYFGIDDDIVWDIIENKIPDLLVKIEHVITAESGREQDSDAGE